MRQHAPGGRPYSVALSGGRIAGGLFESTTRIARSGGGKSAGMDSTHFFWGDERCVPPDDPESNFRLAQELLLGPLGIPGQNIHRVRGELPPDQGAREAAEEICEIAPLEDGQPVLDLIFLGVGENGHVASLFPEEPEEVRASKAVYRAIVTQAKPPPHRITLGYPAIAAARQVWVLASGSGKEEVVRQSLEPAGQTPLARVLQAREFSRIFTDLFL